MAPHKYTPFKEQFSFETRLMESSRIREKYPDRLPIIVEQRGTGLPPLDKAKFLINGTLPVSNFVYVIRKRLKMTSEQGIFLHANNTLLNGQATLDNVFRENVDADGFLYITYSAESVFGGESEGGR